MEEALDLSFDRLLMMMMMMMMIQEVTAEEACIFICCVLYHCGDRGSTVVKVLCYKSEGHYLFDSRWCHWNFSLT